MNIILRNIGVLATPLGSKAKGGPKQGEISFVKNAFVAIKDGKVAYIGDETKKSDKDFLRENFPYKEIDANGKLVTPGLVDPHTHLIFAGWRQKELSLKIKGYKYLDILKMGGGILYTVEKTRNASLQELVENAKKSLKIMLSYGTTTCEAKSGYGLNVEDELKSLRAIQILNESQPVEIVPTFMGAHAVPNEYKDKREYIRIVKEVMIPKVKKENLAEFCDVFCEEGVFDLKESEEILEQGKKYGLIPKIHADEITSMGGAKLAAKVGAVSAEHLIHADDEGIEELAKKGVIAVLLPGTSFYLGENFAKAEIFKEKNVPIALATDFNPGSSPNESLQIVMNLACLKYKLTPEEVLTAVTLNAAAAINRASKIGTIEEGKNADIIIWEAEDLDFICYHYGTNLVNKVIKKGELVWGVNV
ncbi:imidazolonepropionase [Thermovenabulum gondwanense]|uniref:Imidazolonepropionase n=1 Tax=Thermovenabulum gondwanense TaxID=520767 RepID=A0A162MHA1_9FIRM|nr:imidazolonepropionase [Thermovenabulum gondwanense]KYO65853.1 Imidazolonepropionase [Thermovenabulum gondwanense]